MTSENEYTDANGVRYVARAQGGCRGCAHFDEFEIATAGCRAAAECRPRLRSDGLPVIWVKAEDGSRA